MKTWMQNFDSNKVVWNAKMIKFGEWRAGRKLQQKIAEKEAERGDGDDLQKLILSLDQLDENFKVKGKE